MTKITHDKLLEVLHYDPDTGIFTWKVNKGSRAPKGGVAGSLEDDGYTVIRLDNNLYKAHRLAWFYCFYEWPELDIDHIDRNRSNNALDNLREVSRSINNTNTVARNALKVKGVYKNGNKYMARIQRNGTDHYLGTYNTIELASVAIQNFIHNENTTNC